MGQADNTKATTSEPDSDFSTRHTGTAAGSSTPEDLKNLRFELLRSALYHDMCESRSRGTHRLLVFVTILLGSGAMAGFGTDFPELGQVAGLLVATLGAAQFVWDFGGQASVHAELRRRFYALLSDIEAGADPTSVAGRMVAIYADEPPCIDRLNRKAHNRAAYSVYGDDFQRA
jgi:hypothetical protein